MQEIFTKKEKTFFSRERAPNLFSKSCLKKEKKRGKVMEKVN